MGKTDKCKIVCKVHAKHISQTAPGFSNYGIVWNCGIVWSSTVSSNKALWYSMAELGDKMFGALE